MTKAAQMNQSRITLVADAIAAIDYDGITAFDKTEPEYKPLSKLYQEFEDPSFVTLLAICATTQNYQLNGNAQAFWSVLEDITLKHEALNSTQTIGEILEEFMDVSVNARLNRQKRKRLIKLFEAGFHDWFLTNHDQVPPVEVWEHLADALDNPMHGKTVVLPMKVYDIANLIQEGEYREFPLDVPIPCDLQVKRVSHAAGITDSENDDQVRGAWAEVMRRVSDQLNRHVSVLRIDSIVWQAGQIIGQYEPSQTAASNALFEYFEQVGLDPRPAEQLAKELTAEM